MDMISELRCFSESHGNTTNTPPQELTPYAGQSQHPDGIVAIVLIAKTRKEPRCPGQVSGYI